MRSQGSFAYIALYSTRENSRHILRTSTESPYAGLPSSFQRIRFDLLSSINWRVLQHWTHFQPPTSLATRRITQKQHASLSVFLQHPSRRSGDLPGFRSVRRLHSIVLQRVTQMGWELVPRCGLRGLHRVPKTWRLHRQSRWATCLAAWVSDPVHSTRLAKLIEHSFHLLSAANSPPCQLLNVNHMSKFAEVDSEVPAITAVWKTAMSPMDV